MPKGSHFGEEDLPQEYRQLWNESERILNILRTGNGEELKRATDEEVLSWIESIYGSKSDLNRRSS